MLVYILCFVGAFSFPNGYHYYRIGSEYISFYSDFSRNGSIWIRLNYRNSTGFYPAVEDQTLTSTQTQNLLSMVKDFGWSDKIDTINTDQSWIIENVKFYQSFSDQNMMQRFSHLFNGKDPLGNTWTPSFTSGYLTFNGTFRTFGSWSTMYVGCAGFLTQEVNTFIVLRSGGGVSHSGEYIHSSCNGYGTQTNSITSLVSWTNTRVFWARIDYPFHLMSQGRTSFSACPKLFMIFVILLSPI